MMLRLWIEADRVRVARDTALLEPQHLESDDRGNLRWICHEEGSLIPTIRKTDFVDWLDNR